MQTQKGDEDGHIACRIERLAWRALWSLVPSEDSDSSYGSRDCRSGGFQVGGNVVVDGLVDDRVDIHH